MRQIVLAILILLPFIVAAQKSCEIAMNPNDCQICLNSYRMVGKIDRSFKPVVILDQMDSNLADYFIHEYLKLKDIPYEINPEKYRVLQDSFGQTLLQFKDGETIKSEFIVKHLPEKLVDLNALANPSAKSPVDFRKVVKSLNDSASKRFYGRKTVNVYREWYSLYTPLSNTLLTANLITGEIKTCRLSDSIMYNLITDYAHADLISKNKRKFYQEEVGGIDEFILMDHTYDGGRLVLYVYVTDYSEMLSKIELESVSNEVWPKAEYYLLECMIENGKLIILSQKEVKTAKKYAKNGIGKEAHHAFIQMDNRPVIFYTDNHDYETSPREHCLPKFYRLEDSSWNNDYVYKRPDLVYQHFDGNTVYNQYIYNRLTNVLVDNNLNKAFRLSPYGYDTMMYENIRPIGKNVYITLTDTRIQKLIVFKIDPVNDKHSVIREYENIGYPLGKYFMFSYYETAAKKLHLVAIKEPFEFYIIDSIPIE